MLPLKVYYSAIDIAIRNYIMMLLCCHYKVYYVSTMVLLYILLYCYYKCYYVAIMLPLICNSNMLPLNRFGFHHRGRRDENYSMLPLKVYYAAIDIAIRNYIMILLCCHYKVYYVSTMLLL